MCLAKNLGPRCFAHANATLRNRVEKRAGMLARGEDLTKIDAEIVKARHDVDLTPTGIAAMENQGFSRIAESLRKERRESLADYAEAQFEREEFAEENPSGYDPRGFNDEGIHRETGTTRNSEGVNVKGFGLDGFSRNNHNVWGESRQEAAGRRAFQERHGENYFRAITQIGGPTVLHSIGYDYTVLSDSETMAVAEGTDREARCVLANNYSASAESLRVLAKGNTDDYQRTMLCRNPATPADALDGIARDGNRRYTEENQADIAQHAFVTPETLDFVADNEYAFPHVLKNPNTSRATLERLTTARWENEPWNRSSFQEDAKAALALRG